MALTSAEYIAESIAAYWANIGYDASDSVAMAKNFRTACRGLIGFGRPTEQTNDLGFSVSLESLKDQLTAVDTWISQHDTTGGSAAGAGARYVSFENFRE